jgi:phosphatidylglycerophosphate synthase
MLISFNKIVEVHRVSIIKNGTTEGFFNVFIFRKISILISWMLASLNVNPNLITTVSFLLTIIGGILLFVDFGSYKIISIILIAFGFIFDMSDGEVARLTNKQSDFGGFYDPFLDRVIDMMLPLLIGIGFFLNLNDKGELILILVILYAAIRSSLFYLEYVNLKLGLSESINSIRRIAVSKFNSITQYIKWDGGFTIFLFAIAIFFNLITQLFIFLLFFYGAIMIIGFMEIRKKLKKK